MIFETNYFFFPLLFAIQSKELMINWKIIIFILIIYHNKF